MTPANCRSTLDGNIVIELLPGVAEKLRPIRDHLIFIVTNQAGIKRGRLHPRAGRSGDRASSIANSATS